MKRAVAKQWKEGPDKKRRKTLILFLSCLAALLVPSIANAQMYEIASVICNLYGWLSTGTGDAVVMSALIALGVSAAYGKIGKGSVISVVCGVGLIYGAGPIVVALGGGTACAFPPNNFTFTCTGGLVDTDPLTGKPYNIFNANAIMGALNSDPVQQVFSHVLFVFKETIGSVMSSMYCSLAYEMQTPLMALFSTYIIIHGILFTLGISKFTIRDLGIFFFKMVLIYVFVTDATWGIGIGYKFFMNFAEEGTNIVLSVLPVHAGSNKGSLAVTSPDAITSNLLTNSTTGVQENYRLCTDAEVALNITAAPGAPPPPSCTCASFAQLQTIQNEQQSGAVTNGWSCTLPICTAAITASGEPCIPTMSQVPQFCMLVVFLIALLLVWFMPFLILFIVLLLVKYIMSFAKAMLNYLTSMVLISFLFILSPFFITFALFRTTMPLFEGWLKHLISFALQMMIMFSFMAMLTLLPFSALFTDMLGLMKEYDHTVDFGFSIPGGVPLMGGDKMQLSTFTMHFCGVCQYFVTPATTFSMSQITCHPQPLLPLLGTTKIITVAGTPTTLHITTMALARQYNNWAAAQAGYMLSLDGNYWVTTMWDLTRDTGIFKYFVIQILALYVLTKVMGDFMEKAPKYAKHLGGAAAAAAIGGGGSSGGGPGIQYPGLESVEAAYYGLKNGLLAGGMSRSHKVLKVDDEGNAVLDKHGRTSTERQHVGLRDRLRYGFMGMEENKYDPKTGATTSSKAAGVGILAGLLKGAHDHHSLEGKAWENQRNLLKKRIARSKNAYNERELTRELNEMEFRGAANFKKGLSEVRSEKMLREEEFYRLLHKLEEAKTQNANVEDLKKSSKEATAKVGRFQANLELAKSTGASEQRINELEQKVRGAKRKEAALKNELEEAKKLSVSEKELKRLTKETKRAGRQNQTIIHRSSMHTSEHGDETAQKIAEWDKRHRERKTYGEYLKDNPNNWYFGMKMPEDVYAVTLTHRIDSTIKQADDMISSIQHALNNLPPSEARDKAQSDLNTAALHLHNASSTQEALNVRQMLNSIKIPKA